ncbi:MAG: DMP19 family protein [Phycisphaerales bacterium]
MSSDRSLFEDRIEMLLASNGNPSVDSDGFKKMDQHQQRMASLFMLENEVSGGGFSRAYFNQDIELGAIAADAYEAIGAKEHAQVVRQSLEAAKKQAESEKASMKGGTLLTMSEDHIKSGYAAVDKAWAAISGMDTFAKKSEYMRKNSKSFGIVLPG